MIPWISHELHQQLLDRQSRNRTYGLEKLKLLLSEVDVKSVPCIEEFLNFLSALLEDSNFRVMFSTLEVLHLLIQKLDMASNRYVELIVSVVLKTFGDTRKMTKNESLKVFRQLMKAVPAQRVVDQVIGNLKNDNPRVREDVLNVIMVAILSHPDIEVNIPELCAKVAPCLVDGARKVRHSAFELFALFNHCLGRGEHQALISAVKMVELTENAEGLMAAVEARQARNSLPKLWPDGILEYGLVLLIPRQRGSLHNGADADLDWVMDGPQVCTIRATTEDETLPSNTLDAGCSQQEVKRRTSKPRPSRTKSRHLEQLDEGNQGREKTRHSKKMVSHSPGEDQTSAMNKERDCNSNFLSDEATPRPIKRDPTVSPDQQEMAPRPSPVRAPDMVMTLELMSAPEREKKIQGLTNVSLLVKHSPDVVQDRLHDVWLSVIAEVKNTQPAVERVALCTLGDMFTYLEEDMDSTLDESVKLLLKKALRIALIRQDADKALDSMVQHCTPTRCLHALLAGGLNDRCKKVRSCMAQHLADVVAKVGAAHIVSGAKDVTEQLIPALGQLAQDVIPDARAFGLQMLLLLSDAPTFDKVLEEYIPPKDLATIQKIVNKHRTKDINAEPARAQQSQRGKGAQRGPPLKKEPVNKTKRSQTQSVADRDTYAKQLSGLMTSKDFRDRLKGIDQLVDDSKNNPNVVISNIQPVFDAVRERLIESNSKVNLLTLKALPEVIAALADNLAQVVNILVPAIVDKHLNSKKEPIYCAAIGAIDALIAHLDNTHLLQLFCNKAMFLNGNAKAVLIKNVTAIVTNDLHHQPQAVKQKVLPLLWHLLGISSHSSSTRSLCRALHEEMGSELSKCAASQPLHVKNSLNKILSTLQ